MHKYPQIRCLVSRLTFQQSSPSKKMAFRYWVIYSSIDGLRGWAAVIAGRAGRQGCHSRPLSNEALSAATIRVPRLASCRTKTH